MFYVHVADLCIYLLYYGYDTTHTQKFKVS